MIEVYTQNASVVANAVIPLQTVSLKKGCTASLNGSSISLNKNGVYMVSVDGVLTSATTGDASIQLYKNGVAVPQATSTDTIATADDFGAVGFTTLVSVNTCPCSDTATTISVYNTGIAVTTDLNVVVTKVC